MTMSRWSALAALAMLVTAGCIATPSQPLDPAASLPIGVPALVRLLEDRAFEVEVPVRVVLVGFDAGTAEALQAKLTPARIDHDFLDATNTISDPQALIETGTGLYPNPVVPIARYEVSSVAPEVASGLLAFAAASKVEGTDLTLYDGRAFEDHLAQVLMPQAATPVFVIVHGGDVLDAEHGWRYTYETGWLDRVRIFGGRLPILVLDASAQSDPYVVRTTMVPSVPLPSTPFTGAPGEPAAYNMPLERGGEAVVEALAQASTDAAHYRIVQGPIYPVSTRPCHTVLVYVGVRATSVAHLVGAADPASLVDTATLTSGFANLTGAPVTVEARVVQLPIEDPALDAATRNDLNYDLFRAWADMNWATFFEDDGCEHYLNTLLVTDAAENVHGIALMDVERNRRISFSWVDDETRLREDDGSPLAGSPLATRPESRTASRWATFLVAHEGGHLFGQTHPHNAIYDEPVEGEREASPMTFAFSSTWDSMSYQVVDRVSDFGGIAQANFQRNRAGFAIGEARAQGLEGSPEFAQALALLGQLRWKEASDALLPALAVNEPV